MAALVRSRFFVRNLRLPRSTNFVTLTVTDSVGMTPIWDVFRIKVAHLSDHEKFYLIISEVGSLKFLERQDALGWRSGFW